MRKLFSAGALAFVMTSAACYHATIETGLQPNGQVIENKWAMSYVAGLVPPPVVETAQKCPDGVARVETQHSFWNSVVAAVTGSILTPITIKVECAAKKTSSLDNGDVLKVGAADARAVFSAAAQRAEETGRAVYVQF